MCAASANSTQVDGPGYNEKLQHVLDRIEEWRGLSITVEQLDGGLANLNYLVRADGDPFVVKLLTQSMDDFGLMIPIGHLIANTVAAGEVGVGARVVRALPDVPALVLEYIGGETLTTARLSEPAYIPRIGEAVRRLHTEVAPFGNRLEIWDFLDRYLGQVSEHKMPTPAGAMDALPTIRTVREVLQATAMPVVASHNDLLPLNLMDDGDIRLIDYDFSGTGDPCFDLGDVAMEGSYSPDDVERLCESYFGERRPEMVARARLFGIAAQYTWSLLFVSMDQLLLEKPDADFDYFQEGVSRWEWTRERLDAPDLGACIDSLRR
jgi:thiamine kinase-like enzyme